MCLCIFSVMMLLKYCLLSILVCGSITIIFPIHLLINKIQIICVITASIVQSENFLYMKILFKIEINTKNIRKKVKKIQKCIYFNCFFNVIIYHLETTWLMSSTVNCLAYSQLRFLCMILLLSTSVWTCCLSILFFISFSKLDEHFLCKLPCSIFTPLITFAFIIFLYMHFIHQYSTEGILHIIPSFIY